MGVQLERTTTVRWVLESFADLRHHKRIEFSANLTGTMSQNESITLDFHHIRGELAPDKRDYFEQLVCHIAALNKTGSFRRIYGAGGDGGVEALCTLPNGDKIGYQAKYYPDTADIDWQALDNSVHTALAHHPRLTMYVIALPCDFTGKRATRGGVTDGIWGKWDARVTQWQTAATSHGISVRFEAWTAFDLQRELLKPAAHHLLQFFFKRLAFSEQWFRQSAQRTIVALQARYSPDDHVPTESLSPFDVIFRRPPLREHLHQIFLMAGTSSPRTAQQQLGRPPDELPDILDCELLLAEFLALRDRINAPFDQPWPLQAWFDSWERTTKALRDHQSWLDGELAHDKEARNRSQTLSRAWDLGREEIFAGRWARRLPIDHMRTLLLVGRAGAGKSHALAHAVQVALSEGAPAVHVLGQYILDDDPRVSILKQVDLGEWRFSDMLAALNLAAEAANTRALLVIDGINEGRGLAVWRNHLATFIHDVNQHDRLVLVMSCRQEYVDYIVRPELVADMNLYHHAPNTPPPALGKLVKFEVSGFSNGEEQEHAMRQFMDKNGIARPASMMLDSEFFNPLFMSSVCRSMAKAKIKILPQGLHATRDMFNFVLEVKCQALGTEHDGKPGMLAVLRAALKALAGEMVSQQTDKVPLQQALVLLQHHFQRFPLTGTSWLEVLEGADILRRDIDGQPISNSYWNVPNEVVRFAFQRLQDNLMAENLVENAGDIDHAFGADGSWAFLVKRRQDANGDDATAIAPAWTGLLGALWAQVAEDFGRELVDLPSMFTPPYARYWPNQMRDVFRVSIRERRLTAFSVRTDEIFAKLWQERWSEQCDVYLMCACIPGHRWNADHLANKLEDMPTELLEKNWLYQFDDNWLECTRSAEKILSWIEVVSIAAADREVLRLGQVLCSWLARVNNQTVRESAERSLARLPGQG